MVRMDINSIFKAVVQGEIKTVKKFFSDCSCVDFQNETGSTLLHLALSNQNNELVYFLLERNAGIEIANKNGDFPLHYGAMFFSGSILEMLMSSVTINAFNNKCATPLHNAVKYSNPEGVIFLLSKGSDINAMKWDNDLAITRFIPGTPLHLAVKNHDLNMAELLLEHGADPNLYDNHGLQPYYYAGWSKDHEMIKLLLKFGSKEYPL